MSAETVHHSSTYTILYVTPLLTHWSYHSLPLSLPYRGLWSGLLSSIDPTPCWQTSLADTNTNIITCSHGNRGALVTENMLSGITEILNLWSIELCELSGNMGLISLWSWWSHMSSRSLVNIGLSNDLFDRGKPSPQQRQVITSAEAGHYPSIDKPLPQSLPLSVFIYCQFSMHLSEITRLQALFNTNVHDSTNANWFEKHISKWQPLVSGASHSVSHKPLLEPMITKFCITIWHHKAIMI